ncbi:hypothetical protein JOF53_003537 [Crossiella equi]|uniref:PPE domain-containing protein n=1 Tax=Crossiella equi TaxID=130796 RepID=A0ABS5ADJ9_9PSEU|nr:PPE domain-containing protein [Crossiella equi]MBP2474665.1 hypothetical protein [Crossiella equi]
MGDHRWQGYSHEELYRQLHTGPGPAASAASITRWQDMSRALADIDADIKSALANSRTGWTGKAADAATGALHPLAQWALEARQGAEAMRQSAELQAEYVGKARADMPEPKAVTAEQPSKLVTGIVHLFGGQTDYEVQEAAQSAAEQRAFEVMEVYQTSTAANTSSLGQFTAPPELHVATGSGAVQGSPVGTGAGVVPVRPGVVPPRQATPSGRTTGSAPAGGRAGGAPVPPAPKSAGATPSGQSTQPAARAGGAVPAPPSPMASGPAGSPRGGAAPSGALPQPRAAEPVSGTSTSAASSARPGPQHRPNWDAAEAKHVAELREHGVLGLSGGLAPAGRARGEEDGEHSSFLTEDDDVFGDGRQYAPPVIGEQ